MKSSTGRFRWLMITLFIVLMAACLGFSMFFMACKGGDSTENPPASSEETPDDGGEEKETTVESVVLSSSELSLTVGESADITVTVTMKEGYETVDFTYAVDANGIITVTQSGDTLTVRADAVGTATITVSADGVSATCKVSVSAASSGEPTYEWVDTYADLETAMNLAGGSGNGHKVPVGGLTVGKFTFGEGAYFEDTNNGVSNYYDINTQSTSITFEVTGLYNDISFHGYRTSGGTAITYTLYSASDMTTAIYAWGPFEDGDAGYYESTGEYLDAGTYVLSPSSAARMYNIKVSEYVEESAPKEITATVATEDFLMGRVIAESDLGITVTLVYENGRKDTITSGYTTDVTTAKLTAGANEITVTYSPNGGGLEFDCKVTIYLYEVESIEISDFSMSYTNSTYYTNNVQKIYLVGDTVSYDYAAVTATASYTDNDGAHATTFILTSTEVNFSTADSTGSAITGAFSDAGTYTVTATVDASLKTGVAVTESYEINVVSSEGADATQVKVDQNATLGMDETTGVYTVKTINDAIQLMKLLNAPDDVRKTITVAAGQYWEKIYIDIPNLSLVGANSSENDKLATRQDSASGGTEIVYWAYNGLMDPSGTTTFSTVGSATVTVAKEAVGFCAANITFRNYWNTNDLYNQCRTYTSNTQADAAYINADKSYFYNVTFTGYHDTLEAENGRQYYDNCYIEGRTDYIFGNTATCYFYKCNIHTIGSGDSKNGGYVVATKGGTSDKHVQYGYIFNECTFDGDDQVTDGTVSIARGWDSYMTIAVINCSLTKAYSTEGFGYSDSNLNDRYTSMNANPVASQLYEYGNTGDGAITVDGTNYVTGEDGIVYQVVGDEKYPLYTALTEETVKDFLDFTKIFAAVNGTYSYDDDWSGASVELVVATVTVDGESYTVTGYKGSLTVADVIAGVNELLSGQEIETLYGADSQPVDGETKIMEDTTFSAAAQEADMTVPASVTYDFSTTDIGTFETSGWYEYLYIDLGTTGTFSTTGDWYNLKDDATITVKLPVGATISIRIYEDATLTVNGATATITTENSEYWYTYTVEGEEAQEIVLGYAANSGSLGGVCIKVIEINVPIVYQIGDKIDLSNATDANFNTGTTGTYKGIEIDATTGKFTYNNAGCIQINQGTILKIQSTPDASAEINFWGSYTATYTVETNEDGLITITFTSVDGGGTYIDGITITDGSAN